MKIVTKWIDVHEWALPLAVARAGNELIVSVLCFHVGVLFTWTR